MPFIAFAKKFGYHFDTTHAAAVAASFNTMLGELKESLSNTCWSNWVYAQWLKQYILLKI